MKKAFSLLELLVVIGIMGVMASLAIASYSSVTRGMNDRAALDVAKSVLDAAWERAKLDGTKTYVYLFDEVVKPDSDMSAGVVAGVAIAVRPVGRITLAPGDDVYYDEFGDLEQTFGILENEDEQKSEGEKEKEAASIRLYNIRTRSVSTVREGVFAKTLPLKDLEDASSDEHEVTVFGFKKVSGDGFRAGDAYGQEFAVTRLPPGYTFSSSVNMSGASSLGQHQVGNVIEVDPAQGAPAVTVYMRRPNGSFVSIGSTSQTKDGE